MFIAAKLEDSNIFYMVNGTVIALLDETLSTKTDAVQALNNTGKWAIFSLQSLSNGDETPLMVGTNITLNLETISSCANIAINDNNWQKTK